MRGVRFRLATTFEEREQAFRILHDAYVERGIAAPTASGLRFSAAGILPSTSMMIAVRDDVVIGVVSLIEDNPLGVPMEDTHPDEVAAVRATGRRFAEVGTLAVSPAGRGRQIALHLYNTMYRWASRHRGIEDLLIAVHPRMNKFFGDVLLFKKLGPVQAYENLNAALSSPLLLDLTSVPREYLVAHNRGTPLLLASGPTNLFRFFVGDPAFPDVDIAPSPAVAEQRSPNPQWSELDVHRLMARCGVALSTLPRPDHVALAAAYPGLRVA